MDCTKSQELIQILPRADGGEAVFATKKIRRGTRLAAELPLIIVPPTSAKDELLEFCKAAYKIGEDKISEIAEINCRFPIEESILEDGIIRRLVWRFYKTKKWMDTKGRHLKGKKLDRGVTKTVGLCAIYLTSSIQLGPEGIYGSGIFSFCSRIAHSCIPNAYSSWNPTLQRLTIHASRDIKAGDQIFVDYTGNVCWTSEQRGFSLFSTWGITCQCAACTDPDLKESRHEMLRLDQALAAYECGASSDENFEAVHKIRRITTADEALEAAEELMELLREQKLFGMQLCKTFRECSKFSLECGFLKKALKYAFKERDLERELIGTEDEHLEAGLCGGKYWVGYVQQEIKARSEESEP
ncbi:SET domain-containing protein [Hypomontagnella monticulosa]|nr:SET domain-containing protein [Hypomontagnella monticulosa]